MPPGCRVEAPWRARLGSTDIEVWVVECGGVVRTWMLRRSVLDSIQPLVQAAPDFDDDNLGFASPDITTDSPEYRQVEALQSGTWLELSLADDSSTRAKLSWISPMTGRYLFVNRRGLKVADYAPRELAALLKQGKARVLAANALFERAMSAIVDRLSHPSPASEEE